MNSNISIGFPQEHITNVFVFVGMESSEESLSSSPADRYVNILSTNVYSKSAFKIHCIKLMKRFRTCFVVQATLKTGNKEL